MRIVSTSRPHSWNMKASPLNVSLFAGCATVLGACLTAATLTRGAQDSPPRWMNEVTLLDPGEHHAIPPCELAYHVSWNGLIKAGEATLKLGLRDPKVPENLLGTCESRSAGLASRLWSYKNVFRSKVDSASLRPIFFEARETEKKERVVTQARFAKGVVTSTETVTQRNDGKAKTKERVFAYDHAHDLLSAVLYLRSHPLKDGDEINMVVHPFKSAYFTKFRVEGRETFDSPLGRQKAIRLGIELYKIDRDDLELKSYDKFKKATIWMSEDAFRLPLEVRSEVFIGSVRATLQSRKILDNPS